MFTAVIRSRRTLPAIFSAGAAAIIVAPVWAAGISSWDGDSRSAARLVAGMTQTRDGKQIDRAGVEIRLAQGWKTYWRYPGDSGVPPHFDFSASENVKTVSVLWPAPQRFDDAEGATIGYKNNVVFPVQIERKEPEHPVILRMTLGYAICERLCIPVEARAEVAIDGKTAGNEAVIAAAEASVPSPQALRASAPLSIWNISRDAGAKPERVLVDVQAAADMPVTLFAEGPTPDWALPLPKPVQGAENPQLRRFEFPLDGLPSGASAKGAKLKLTAVSGAHAIETELRLD